MKKRTSFIVTLVCGILLLASCHRGPDYALLIPSDAVMVMDIQLEQLFKKGDLKHADELAMVKLLRQDLSSENAETASLINDLFEHPETTGLDLMGDVVIYASANSQAAVIMPMSSRRKFEKFLARVMDEEDLKIEKKEGLYHLVTNDEMPYGLCWDKEKVMLTFKYGTDVERQMPLDKDQSLAANKDFKSYWKNRGDISFWYSMDALFSMLDAMGAADELNGVMDSMKGMSYSANVNFEKGAMRTDIELFGVDKDSDLMKMYGQKLNGKLLDFMPETCLMGFTAMANMEYAQNFIGKMGKSAEILDEEIAEGLTWRDIYAVIGGSYVANLYGFGTTEKGGLLPLFSAAADLKDVDKVKSMLAQAKLEQNGDGLWIVPGIPLYIGMKNDILFVTDELAAAQTMLGKGYKNGMKDVAKKAKKGNYFYANLRIDDYPDVVKNHMSTDLIDLLREYLDYTEMVSTSMTTAQWSLYLKDKKQNSLASTLRFIDNNLMRFGSLFQGMGQGLGNTDDCPVVTEEFYVDEDGE